MTRLSSIVREIINDYHRQFGEQGLPGVRLVKPGDTSAQVQMGGGGWGDLSLSILYSFSFYTALSSMSSTIHM
jgi:hypothetical protein